MLIPARTRVGGGRNTGEPRQLIEKVGSISSKEREGAKRALLELAMGVEGIEKASLVILEDAGAEILRASNFFP